MNPLSQGIGTSFYMSPEQENGSQYDTKTDMYSLGVIIFEMFAYIQTGFEKAKYFTLIW